VTESVDDLSASRSDGAVDSTATQRSLHPYSRYWQETETQYNGVDRLAGADHVTAVTSTGRHCAAGDWLIVYTWRRCSVKSQNTNHAEG